MKNVKALGLLLLALLTGLAAAVYAAGWVSRQSGIASNKVVVAAVDIELGSRVNPQMLSLVDWPSGSLPPGSFKDAKALEDRVSRSACCAAKPSWKASSRLSAPRAVSLRSLPAASAP